eukprot:5338596-Pleurochrysis_carterae.AAC.1
MQKGSNGLTRTVAPVSARLPPRRRSCGAEGAARRARTSGRRGAGGRLRGLREGNAIACE